MRAIQAVIVVVFAAALPAGAVFVFGFDTDRAFTADAISVVFFGALVLLLSTPWWPLPSQRHRTTADRVQSTVFIWFGVTFATHLTWELLWLVLHDSIVSSRDAAWAYPWWMYIDGGDGRYATADPMLITQEVLSVANGVIGFTGLYLWWRSRGAAVIATLLLMATAVVHLYSTSVYFGSEIFDGYPNVDTGSVVDLWIKFVLLNGLWLVLPWLVLWWGRLTLGRQQLALSAAPPPP